MFCDTKPRIKIYEKYNQEKKNKPNAIKPQEKGKSRYRQCKTNQKKPKIGRTKKVSYDKRKIVEEIGSLAVSGLGMGGGEGRILCAWEKAFVGGGFHYRGRFNPKKEKENKEGIMNRRNKKREKKSSPQGGAAVGTGGRCGGMDFSLWREGDIARPKPNKVQERKKETVGVTDEGAQGLRM